MKRPLGIIAILFAIGIALGHFFELPLFCLFSISFAFALAAFLLPRFRLYLLYPLLLFAGWTNLALHSAIISPTDLRLQLTGEPQLATLRGTLAATPTERAFDSDRGQTFTTLARLNVTALQTRTDWQPAFGQIEISTSGQLPKNFFQDQKVQIYGVIETPPLPIAEGLFDRRAWLRHQEIYFQLKAKPADWQLLSTDKTAPPFRDRFLAWAKTALAIGRTNTDETLRLEQSLTLGDKTYLTDDVTEPFVRASTFHIFAVDGLRMAILFGIFFYTFRWLRMPRVPLGLILIPLCWSYVALTGWSPSAVRAAVMLTIVIFGWMLKRPVDVLNSLYTAAFIILLWQPHQLFEAGFQLSFVVVYCIFRIMPIFDALIQRALQPDPLLPEELRPRWQPYLHTPLRWTLDLLCSSFAAWLASIPLVALYFHILTPVSTPANLLAVPLCGAVLVCNIISLLLAAWFAPGAAAFNFLGWHFMEGLRITSLWFAHWPHAYWYVAAPGTFTILLYYSILLAAFTGWLFQREWRAAKFTALLLLLSIWTVQFLHQRSATRLTILPLNGGHAVYCDAPGDANDLLIDCGNTDSVELLLKPWLRAEGINSIPSLALTHGSVQQVGGFATLDTLTHIEKIITSAAHFRSPAYRSILQSLETTPARHAIVNCGDAFCHWTVLHPGATSDFKRADDNSLVLLGETEGTRILFLSNLGRSGQQALLESRADLHADIVIAGLPDQTEPLSDTLLAAIHPQLILIADSQSPATRRAPHPLLARLARHRIPTLCASDLGALTLSLRNNEWKVETMENLTWSGTTH